MVILITWIRSLDQEYLPYYAYRLTEMNHTCKINTMINSIRFYVENNSWDVRRY